MSTTPGSDTFQISDQLTNEGSSDQEFQLIYHGNYGSSILEEGATVYAPASSVTPMNENAAKYIDSWQTYLGPTKGFTEQVYLLEPLGDGNSSTMALLVNKDADRATSVRWNVSDSHTSPSGKILRRRKTVMSPGSSPPPVFRSTVWWKENMVASPS